MTSATTLGTFEFGHWQIVLIGGMPIYVRMMAAKDNLPRRKKMGLNTRATCRQHKILDEIISVLNSQLEQIPLTQCEKDFCLRAVAFEKFRQITIWIDAGGYFGMARSREEVADGEWSLFWVYLRDPGAGDHSGYHNIHYKLRPDGKLILTRDE